MRAKSLSREVNKEKPSGLTSSLEREEFIDLVGFLSKVGEQGAFRVPTATLVRRWDVLSENKKAEKNSNERGLEYPLKEEADLSWQPVYSKVSGDLPVDELPIIRLKEGQSYSYITFDLEVLSEGKVDLLFNATQGITMWADQEMLEKTDNRYVVDLAKGMHKFTLAINRDNRKKNMVHIEIQEANSSPAQTKLIRGK